MLESAKVDRKTAKSKKILRCVAEYNLCTAAVDEADMAVTMTGTVTRKSIKWCKKWCKKYFFHLDITVLNSNILKMTASAKKRSMADFLDGNQDLFYSLRCMLCAVWPHWFGAPSNAVVFLRAGVLTPDLRLSSSLLRFNSIVTWPTKIPPKTVTYT